MSASALAGYTKNAATSGTAAAALVAQCQDTLTEPSQYATRGGADSSYWPGSAVACAFAYLTTKNSQYLTQALTYWRASLDDDQTLGDGLGCVQGVSTNWQSWASGGQSGSAPPVILTVTHDSGYPIRWYGPDIAATYDWLHDAPGVDSALLQQTQTCLTNWVDYYTGYGYHQNAAGANYNAGYVAAKAFAAVALGNDDGADGHLWTQVLDTDVGTLLEGTGLAGGATPTSAPGLMVGGDWGEGWEYGPIAVLEYAATTAALENSGASLPAMDAWTSSLVLRDEYATTPAGTGVFCGNGDCDITTPNNTQNLFTLDAVLLGSPSAQAASWALSTKQTGNVAMSSFSTLFYDALAEVRAVSPASYAAQSTAPPLSYLARGTRSFYARSGWNDANASWGVFMSAPQIESDHQHFAASNFVFSHGGNDLIVDPSPYGGYTSWETNAVTADSAQVAAIPSHDFAPSQTCWSHADLPWARGTSDATYGARSDFAHAFDTGTAPSDIPYAHREWTMLPEGEVVLIDRVDTGAASQKMYVTLHTNTGGGGLAASNGVYTGKVGSSQVAIHPVVLGGATPAVTQPSTGNCSLSCNYPCGQCDVAKFPVDEYRAAVPGPWAVAVHVVDGLASGEQAATVGSMNDATNDPSGTQNAGVVGASVLRSAKQSYVVASSARDGASPSTMTYGVPGTSDARHVVYDAPEAADGTSQVTATAQSGRCVVSIVAGAGKGFTGHPLMFQVAAASAGCQVSDTTSVGSGAAPGGGGTTATDAGAPITPGPGAGGPTSGPGDDAGATEDGGASNGSTSGGSGASGGGGTSGGGSAGPGCANEAPARGPGVNAGLIGFVALAGMRRKRARRD